MVAPVKFRERGMSTSNLYPHSTAAAHAAKAFAVVKRSVIVQGHKTSVSLEDAFWDSLKEIAQSRGIALTVLIAEINSERITCNLSSAIRLYVLDYFRARAIAGLMIGTRHVRTVTETRN